MNLHLFTLEEANALLPTLTEAWRQLLDLRLQAVGTGLEYERWLQEEGRTLHPRATLRHHAASEERVAELRASMRQAQATLEATGVLLRDVDNGRFDFPALRDGQPVYYCWVVGETEVTWWHSSSESFSQRRALQEGTSAASLGESTREPD